MSSSQIAANGVRTVQVGGVNGVPLAGSGITAVAVDVAVLSGAGAIGHLQAYPDNASPGAPAVQYYPNSITSDLAIVPLGPDGGIDVQNSSAGPIDVVVDVEGWYSNVGAAIPSGQARTQADVTLQGDANGGGNWVTYNYRVGTTGTFAAVPVSQVTIPGTNTNPAGWPVARNGGGTFDPYTWNPAATVGAANSLVQVEACFGSSASDPNPVCSMPANVTYAPSAFGDSYATENVGPGSLSDVTGDYRVSATDAAAATSLGGLSVGRTLTTLAPPDAGLPASAQRTNSAGVLGPGWTADLSGPDAGDASLAVNDQSASGYLTFTDTDGAASVYQATSPLATYPISFAGVGDAAGDGTTVTKKSASVITMTDPDGTITTWTLTGSAWTVTSVVQPGSSTTSTYTYTGAGLVSRILAPVPLNVTCTSPDTTPGCRSLTFTYQTLNLSGTNVTRLQTVSLSVPQTTGVSNVIPVEDYDYNPAGQLADAYDPRISPALKTAYTYDSNGRLSTLAPPGQAAWTFGYNSAGQLTTLSRPDPSGPTATTTIIYNVPFTGSGAPVELGSAATATWDQTTDLPVTGTAIFDADHVPAGTTAATVATSDWPYATIHYVDVNGREVNTAQYGAGAWQVDTHQFDANGNDTWDLTAGNRAQALTPTPATDPYVAAQTSSAIRANLLASTTSYNPLNPSEVTDTFGPTHPVTLANGTVIDGQDHVATAYDQGAPNNDITATGGSYGLATTITKDPYNVTTSTDTPYPDAQTVLNGYAAIDSGDTDGWTLRQPTTVTTEMGGSIPALVKTTRYNLSGQTIETRLPAGAAGGTAQSTLTSYYTATGSGGCVSPVWAGLVCSVGPAAQPATGSPLPVTTYTYDQYGNQVTKTDTTGTGAGATVRTTTDSYDAAGRHIGESISVTPATSGGTPLPAVTYSYDPATGLPTITANSAGQSLTTGYDDLGRATSYTDANGTVSTRGYDLAGNLTSLSDGQGTITYTYDSTSEHRGLITSENLGITGQPSAFTASYDPAGNLTAETYPNGLVATTSYDNTDNPTALAYTMAGATWMTFTATRGDQDRIVAQTSPQSSEIFAYDPNGRLTTVNDTTGGACTTRSYGYDADSNRTSLTSYPAATGGGCSTTTPPTVTTTSYDQADRDTNPGYSYDPFGRTLTVPGVDTQGLGAYNADTGPLTLGYYSNDMVASQSQGAATLTYTLDPLQNRINTISDGTTTTTNPLHRQQRQPGLDLHQPHHLDPQPDRPRPQPGRHRRPDRHHHPPAGQPARRHHRYRRRQHRRHRHHSRQLPRIQRIRRRAQPRHRCHQLRLARRQTTLQPSPRRPHPHGRPPLQPQHRPLPPNRPHPRWQRQLLRLRWARPHQQPRPQRTMFLGMPLVPTSASHYSALQLECYQRYTPRRCTTLCRLSEWGPRLYPLLKPRHHLWRTKLRSAWRGRWRIHRRRNWSLLWLRSIQTGESLARSAILV